MAWSAVTAVWQLSLAMTPSMATASASSGWAARERTRLVHARPLALGNCLERVDCQLVTLLGPDMEGVDRYLVALLSHVPELSWYSRGLPSQVLERAYCQLVSLYCHDLDRVQIAMHAGYWEVWGPDTAEGAGASVCG